MDTPDEENLQIGLGATTWEKKQEDDDAAHICKNQSVNTRELQPQKRNPPFKAG